VIAILARRLTFALVVAVTVLMVIAPAGRALASERAPTPNEESPEDRGAEKLFETEGFHRETRPQILRKRSRPAAVVRAVPLPARSFASVALPPHPLQLSCRRLL
jgi:hypothetical protein